MTKWASICITPHRWRKPSPKESFGPAIARAQGRLVPIMMSVLTDLASLHWDHISHHALDMSVCLKDSFGENWQRNGSESRHLTNQRGKTRTSHCTNLNWQGALGQIGAINKIKKIVGRRFWGFWLLNRKSLVKCRKCILPFATELLVQEVQLEDRKIWLPKKVKRYVCSYDSSTKGAKCSQTFCCF